MTGKEYFMRVLEAERRMRSLKAQRAHLLDLATGNAAFSTGGVRAHSGGHSKIELAVVQLVDKEQQIAGQIERYIALVQEAERVINSLEDARYRQVLTLRYLAGMRWEKIAAEMGYTDLRFVFRLHGRALLAAENKLTIESHKGPVV